MANDRAYKTTIKRLLFHSQGFAVCVSLCGLALFLHQTLSMPFLGDDTFNAYLDGWIGYERFTPTEAFRQLYFATNVDSGRFYPVYTALLFFDFHIVRDAFALKCIVLIAILINALTFYIVLRRAAPAVAIPALVALPAVFQIRYFHDAIIQFSLHMQLAWEFSLLAAMGIVYYRRALRLSYLTFGAIAYLCATLTYEVTYGFLPLLLTIIALYVRDRRRRAYALAAYSLSPILCSLVAIWIRSHGAADLSKTYVANFAGDAVLRAVLLQSIGAVPLSYLLSAPGNLLQTIFALIISRQFLFALVLTLPTVAFLLRRSSDRTEAANLRATAIFAASLMPLSSILIALAARWQNELKPGLAYTPVYFEYFGVAVLLGIMFVALRQRLSSRVAVIGFSLIVSTITAVTYKSNAIALSKYVAWSAVVPNALQSGVLASLHDGDTVYLDSSYPANVQKSGDRWDAKYFIFYGTGKRVVVSSIDSIPLHLRNRSFVLKALVRDFNDGSVVAGPIVASTSMANDDRALVEAAGIYKSRPLETTISHFRSGCGPVPLTNVLAGDITGLRVLWGSAFYEPENDQGTTFRWSAERSTLRLYNSDPESRHVIVRFKIRPANPSNRVLVTNGRNLVDQPATGDMSVEDDVTVYPRTFTTYEISSVNPVLQVGGRTLLFEVRDLKVTEPAC